MNGACGPVMRKLLHDILSKDTILLTCIEQCSSANHVTHPTRSEASIDSFAYTGKVFRSRALLECERRFFDDKIEETFAESNA